jgi:F-type H+-transporting ATPase subunit epsilon
MPATLQLEIITPEGHAFNDPVELVTLPGLTGQFGVYPQHVPLITQMEPGEIIARKGGHDVFLAVGEGVIEVAADRVSILTDLAVEAEKIDEAKAEEARLRAEARLREKLSDEEVASVNAALARSLVQLRVKRRHRGDRS